MSIRSDIFIAQSIECCLDQVENGASDGEWVRLSALGKAISKAVTVAEILKRVLPELHSVSSLSLFL